jgi:hypothetical protein
MRPFVALRRPFTDLSLPAIANECNLTRVIPIQVGGDKWKRQTLVAGAKRT